MFSPDSFVLDQNALCLARNHTKNDTLNLKWQGRKKKSPTCSKILLEKTGLQNSLKKKNLGDFFWRGKPRPLASQIDTALFPEIFFAFREKVYWQAAPFFLPFYPFSVKNRSKLERQWTFVNFKKRLPNEALSPTGWRIQPKITK